VNAGAVGAAAKERRFVRQYFMMNVHDDLAGLAGVFKQPRGIGARRVGRFGTSRAKAFQVGISFSLLPAKPLILLTKNICKPSSANTIPTSHIIRLVLPAGNASGVVRKRGRIGASVL
jgi:hypothetical protein